MRRCVTLGSVEFAISTVAALILLTQVAVMARQRRLLVAETMSSIRAEWRALRSAWLVTVAIGGSMYVEIDEQVIARYPSAQKIRDAHEETGSVTLWRGLFKGGPPSPELTQAVRDTLEFLAGIATQVLRGNIAPAVAYDTLGTSVVRNGANLRRVLDEPSRSSYYSRYYPGMRTKVLILLDILWVEALLARDVDKRELQSVKAVKIESGTGARNRRRIAVETVPIGGRVRAIRLGWYLTQAEIDAEKAWSRSVLPRIWRLLVTKYDPALDSEPATPEYPDTDPII